MTDVISALVDRAARPDDIFCRFVSHGQTRTLTARQVLAGAARYAHLFRAAGLGPDDVVVIVLKHAPDLYFGFLGAMLARCAPSFMPFPSAKQDPHHYWAQHREVFARIGVAAVVTYEENAAVLAEECPGLKVFTPADAAGLPEDFPVPKVGGEDIAFLQHSSGTTGLKKGVMLSYGAVERQLDCYAEALALGPGDTIVSWLPLYHDMGMIACFMLPLTKGAPLVSLDAFEWVAQPDLLFQAIEDFGGTHAWLPNFAFHHLIRAVREDFAADLSGMKAFVDCSEPCRMETFALFEQTFARLGVRAEQLRVCYAMAETVFAVTQTPAGELARAVEVDEDGLADGRAQPPVRPERARQVISVGAPIRDVELKVVDDAGAALPDDVVGEVAARAPFLFSGYHKDPERTAAKLRGGWYHTGDLGFLRDRELYLLGRTDDLVILNGRNVFAHHVEFAINAGAPQVKAGRCVALGVFSEAVGSQELVIIAEVQSDETAVRRQVARAVREIVLDGFGVLPKEVKMVEPGWLAKTTSGKIARDLNLRKYLDAKGGRTVSAAT